MVDGDHYLFLLTIGFFFTMNEFDEVCTYIKDLNYLFPILLYFILHPIFSSGDPYRPSMLNGPHQLMFKQSPQLCVQIALTVSQWWSPTSLSGSLVSFLELRAGRYFHREAFFILISFIMSLVAIQVMIAIQSMIAALSTLVRRSIHGHLQVIMLVERHQWGRRTR